MTTEQCPAAELLARRATEAGWAATVTYGVGHLAVTVLADAPRGDGTRPRVESAVPVASACVRLARDGRAARAVWVSRGETTAKGALRWAFDQAWRGRHAGEHAPRPLRAAELTAYVTEPDTLELGEAA